MEPLNLNAKIEDLLKPLPSLPASQKKKAKNPVYLEKKITRLVGKAIGDFKQIEEGDRILVAVSGGKDSWVLLHVLELLRRRAPVDFSLVAVNIDQGYTGFRQDKIEDYVAGHGYQFQME